MPYGRVAGPKKHLPVSHSVRKSEFCRPSSKDCSSQSRNAGSDTTCLWQSTIRETGKTSSTSCNIRRVFSKILAASGLPKIRLHDLRDTPASVKLNHGIPILIVSTRLGHSKPGIMIDIYGYLHCLELHPTCEGATKKTQETINSWVFAGKTSL